MKEEVHRNSKLSEIMNAVTAPTRKEVKGKFFPRLISVLAATKESKMSAMIVRVVVL